ncbi:MAG: diaminopimelate decarboxylase [Bacteroidetes bacterium]|nr:diaminopimelate decarboxylase [Bacteroidota bacterium]
MPSFQIDETISQLYNSIAEQYGTPSYVYHEFQLEKNLSALKNLFKNLPVNWLYAMKANDNPFLLKIISLAGFGFDTVSFEEVLLASKFTTGRKIFYTENNMTDVEMHAAIKAGITLNIGSLTRLKKFAEAAPNSECSIRIKPDIGDGHHSKVVTGNMDSKFGIRIDKIEEAVRLAKEHNVKITGIHAHIGSGIKQPQNLLNAIEKMLELALLVPDLKSVNFGGGLPIPYKLDENSFDLEEFEAITSPMLKKFLAHHPDVKFMFEPGRFIIGNAGVLLAQVNTVKDQGNKTYLGTDTGFNHLVRPVMYEAYHHIENVTRFDSKEKALYEIAGNICESGDIFASDRELAVTKENDLIAFRDTGAYGMTMASPYNRRAFPAEILIEKDGTYQQIRKRETAEEMIEDLLKKTGFTF